MNPLICREWEHLPVGKDNLTRNDVEQLHTYAERAARRLNLQRNAVLSRTSGGLQAGQVVSILVTPSKSVLSIRERYQLKNANRRFCVRSQTQDG